MKIAEIRKDSPAEDAGLHPGDDVLEVNGGPVRDAIDFLYYGSDEELQLRVRRGEQEFEVEFESWGDHGIVFEPMDFMSCGNRCVFCFVDQNPPGMRNTIYFKDEDYRLSFLHGAYVTLTTLRERELERIIEQRLSPLYISVHATDPEVRRSILGISRDDHMMEKIDRLVDEGIILHTQIVVCPGLNDGAVLERSIRELGERFPGVESVAVVPVGLTEHRAGLFPLRPVNAEHARATIGLVDRLREEFRGETGLGFAYCSDEWYIRADEEVPDAEYYDDFPQIENGVGMVRDFLDAAERLETVEAPPRYRGKITLVTGVSMGGYIRDYARRLAAHSGQVVRAVAVENRFYGSTVTVSGLLAGGDIMSALEGIEPGETVVLPPNCLNDDGLFLDDRTPDDIARAFGVTVVQGGYDPVETFYDFGEDEE